MNEPLDPYEVAQIAANERTARFEVTITGTLDAIEIDSEDGVMITIDGIEIPLHWRYTFSRPYVKDNIKVRRIDE